MSDELEEPGAEASQPLQSAGACSPGAHGDTAHRALALKSIATQLLNINTKLETFLTNFGAKT